MAPWSHQDGFTLVEVLAAAIVLVVGLLGLFTALDSSSHLNTTVQRQSAVTAQAERAVEAMRALPYGSLGLTATPGTSTDTASPAHWVDGGRLEIVRDFNNAASTTLPGTPTAGESFVTGGPVDPAAQRFTVGGLSGSLYRYVTWVDESCPLVAGLGGLGAALDACPGAQDAKRIVVAAVLDSSAGVGALKPVWITTYAADPKANLLSVAP